MIKILCDTCGEELYSGNERQGEGILRYPHCTVTMQVTRYKGAEVGSEASRNGDLCESVATIERHVLCAACAMRAYYAAVDTLHPPKG